MKQILLLPNKFRIVGVILVILGLVLTYVRFAIGLKPDFLNQKVFAIYTSIIKSNYFSITRNNIFEEICGLTILFGLISVAFSKEKIETEQIQSIRFSSFLYAIYGNLILTIVAFIFIYGLGFIYFSIVNIYLGLILYILIFRISLYKEKK